MDSRDVGAAAAALRSFGDLNELPPEAEVRAKTLPQLCKKARFLERGLTNFKKGLKTKQVRAS